MSRVFKGFRAFRAPGLAIPSNASMRGVGTRMGTVLREHASGRRAQALLPRAKITAVVRKFAWLVPTLMAVTIWAQPPKRNAAGPVGDGGLAVAASINGPRGIAIDGTKAAYIIESFGDFIRRVDLTTGVISTIQPRV